MEGLDEHGTAEEAEAAPAAAPSQLEAAIDAWVVEHIHNSPVARATEAYNHLISVIPDLKKRLAAGL